MLRSGKRRRRDQDPLGRGDRVDGDVDGREEVGVKVAMCTSNGGRSSKVMMMTGSRREKGRTRSRKRRRGP